MARTFGAYTLIGALARLYAAYNITDRTAYELCMWTFAVTAFFMWNEMLVHRTVRKGVYTALVVSGLSIDNKLLLSFGIWIRVVTMLRDSWARCGDWSAPKALQKGAERDLAHL
ncbi:hypothetical protein HK102_008446 [Quaeritorhiza haematococci]|nr:hypothetical protein HK102_008446 [Quaeritorhiza haematococci]